MVTQMNVWEAKTHVSRLLQRVMNGELVIIAKARKPVTRLSPIEAAPEPRSPRDDGGEVAIAADFDALLPAVCVSAIAKAKRLRSNPNTSPMSGRRNAFFSRT